MSRLRIAVVTCLSALLLVPIGLASRCLAADPESDVLAGHSYHGEAFNEGPRQSAYLMPGMGNLQFPCTTDDVVAQRFINQGVAQLHGFWYYEAERSFRQAAVLDPDCAMAYWGMAMANSGNRERAKEFILEANERLETVSARESLYIRAAKNYFVDVDEDDIAGDEPDEKPGKGEAKKKSAKEIAKDRAMQFTQDLEEIVEEYPDDVEAKAFLAVQLWQNARADLPIVSHVAVDSVIQDIFDANPMHPAHHYRIHLWDRHKPKRALQSAANCGPSLPGVAHMWHMPGHIYDKLHRYHDAVWQQEASARVDHAHMMRDRVLPDQIHNFAHNNEWLIRNLLKIGRVEDALALAKNMLELPRHPKYNTLQRGSTKYGRERLLLALSSYRLWPELIDFAQGTYLEPTDDKKLQIERLQYLGVASALAGKPSGAEKCASEISALLEASQSELDALQQEAKLKDSDGSDTAAAACEGSDAESNVVVEVVVDSKKAKINRERRLKQREKRVKELEKSVQQLKKTHASIQAAIFASEENWAEALKAWKDSALTDNTLKAEWMFAAGEEDEALELIAEEVEEKPGQLIPLAVQSHLQFLKSGATAAEDTFSKLRSLAATADLATPLLARLLPLAIELDATQDWAFERAPAEDLGERPDLDTLGPFRWHPYMAPNFIVSSQNNEKLHLKKLAGRPTLVIFYLGFGCLHCIEQLHEFSPRAEEFRETGIEILAISSEDVESLNEGLDSYSKPLEIPLHSDPELVAFKAFRCYDDFELQPLHGTFLIDPNGRVLWQDISYEPFMDVDFAINESRRLLTLAGFGDVLKSPVEQKSPGEPSVVAEVGSRQDASEE